MEEALQSQQDCSQALASLQMQFTPSENEALKTILPYFIQDITRSGSSRLTLDHVMKYLEKSRTNRTKCFNCIVRNVPPDMILSCSKTQSGSCRSRITFLNFQGFCLALLQFRNPRAQLAQRLASKCTLLMAEMLHTCRLERGQLRRETHQLKKRLEHLEEVQSSHTQILPLITAYYKALHSSEPPQEFLLACLTRILKSGLAHHRGVGQLASIPYLNSATHDTLDRVWDICSAWKPL